MQGLEGRTRGGAPLRTRKAARLLADLALGRLKEGLDRVAAILGVDRGHFVARRIMPGSAVMEAAVDHRRHLRHLAGFHRRLVNIQQLFILLAIVYLTNP